MRITRNGNAPSNIRVIRGQLGCVRYLLYVLYAFGGIARSSAQPWVAAYPARVILLGTRSLATDEQGGDGQ